MIDRGHPVLATTAVSKSHQRARRFGRHRLGAGDRPIMGRQMLPPPTLFPPPTVPKHQRLPPKIRQAILAFKAEYPAFHAHEIAYTEGICLCTAPLNWPGARGDSGQLHHHPRRPTG
jgi:hypothetical protein